jgi:hypothetical protein
MFYSWRQLSCPKCRKTLIIHITSLMFFIKTTSGLGPNRIRCSACNTDFNSGLREWTQMSVLQQLWFLVLSAVYALLLTPLFTMATLEVVRVVLNPADPNFPPTRVFQICFAIFAILILCFQALRVALSFTRVDEGVAEQPMSVSFWTWQTNPQGLGMLLAGGALILYIALALVFK